MRYSGSLVKKEREDIFKLFVKNSKLKFSEIEKAIKIRSNMVSYHLEKMQEQGLVEKKGEYYYLTKGAEKYLPVLEHVVGEELSPVPVVLIAVTNNGRILLLKRNKRPYKGYWGLIGGKMLLEESFPEASLRLVKEKANLDGDFVSVNAVLHERVKSDDIIKHSFILFFTKMKSSEDRFRESEHGKLKWFSLDELGDEKIIPSDLWLIKNKLDVKVDVKSAFMEEKDGKLSEFRILE